MVDWKSKTMLRASQDFIKLDKSSKLLNLKKRKSEANIEDYICRYLTPPETETN